LLRLRAVGDNAAMQTEPSKAEPPKRRRWFQFSLRTLTIGVTLFALIPCGYVGQQVKIVRERDATRLDLKDHGWGTAGDPKPLPFIRRWLGDEGYSMIIAPRETSSDRITRVKAVFPESTVSKYDSPNLDLYGWPKPWPPQSATKP
jgi:hypothetical protein